MTPLDLPPMRKDRQALRGIRLQPLRQMKLSPQETGIHQEARI